MIPKIIHYCWFGGNPMPAEFVKYIDSWRKILPDYEIKEWNESNFDVNSISYTREAYKLKKYAFVSDYARLVLLYKFGGIYMDTDVEVVKPFDDLVEKGPFMGLEKHEEFGEKVAFIAPGLIMCAPAGHPFYKKAIERYKMSHFVGLNGNITFTIPLIITELLTKGTTLYADQHYVFEGIHIYPEDYFCPRSGTPLVMKITENTRTIHWYSATWVGEKPKFARLYRYIRKIKWLYVRFF